MLELMSYQELKVLLVHKVQSVHRVFKVRLALKAFRVLLAHRVYKAQSVLKVFRVQ